MTSVRTLIQRYPVLSFYTLAFAISWGGFLWVIGGLDAIPATGAQVDRLVPYAMLMWFAGPSVAGLLLTALVDGRAGLAALLKRMLKWRVGARWYAVALLTAPLLYLIVLLPLSLFSPQFLPGILSADDKGSMLLFGIAMGLVGGGLLEELGWTGFAVHKLRLRHGVVPTALIVGVLHGAVHFSVIFWMSASTLGGLPLGPFLTARGLDLLIGGLVAYRILMVWVYNRTNGSLLVAMLMHASLSTCMLILGPTPLSGVPFLVYLLASSVAAWVVAGAVALANRGHLSPLPLHREIGAMSR